MSGGYCGKVSSFHVRPLLCYFSTFVNDTNIDKNGIACTVPRLDVPIRPCIALYAVYGIVMRRYIISIAYVYSYVIIIRTARHVQKYVTDSDCVGISVYVKRSSADFDNDNITIRYFLSTYNINYVT